MEVKKKKSSIVGKKYCMVLEVRREIGSKG